MSPIRSAMPTSIRISPLQFLLLIQLEASPKYGYEMLKSIKEAFEGVWEPKTGTIYPALKSLEKRGLVDTQVRDSVDFYCITEKGRQFLLQIGSHQERSMKFSARFIATLTKWMSPEFKNEILSSFANMANEDLNLIGGVINFLNEDVEKETRLTILKSMQRNMSKRLDDLDIIIRKMEVETP